MPILAELPNWFLRLLAVSLGLAFGSFLNVVIHRLPREQSLSLPGSRCPGCETPIRVYDNIPVLSWLVLRGRARCCGNRISPRYPLVEAIGGLLAWAVVEQIVLPMAPTTSGWVALGAFASSLALGLGLIALAFIDLEFMILPDEITIGGAVLGLATVPLRTIGWVGSIAASAGAFLLVWLLFDVAYRALRGQSGMGLGDAKLLMLAGAWFGWQGATFALLAGAVQGTLVTLVVFLVQGRIEEPEAVKREREELLAEIENAEGAERAELEEELARDPLGTEATEGLAGARIPFGPFLAIATLEYLLLGDVIVNEANAFLLMP